ncbi:MAG: hypothetical protein NZ937_08200, partial [Armatimonadetes bacterium]|nr:hypothetical protein [Armatimonadota bacterium]
DPSYIALRVLEWNEQLPHPFGIEAVKQILLGDEYALGRAGNDERSRKARLRRAKKCPWFGVLKGVENARNKVNQVLMALQQSGYIELVERQLANGRNYLVARLTQKGRQAVRAGKYLWLGV